MCGKSANEAFEAARERLATAGVLLVTTHARPDGDGLGAMVALARSARGAGKKVHLLLLDDIPGQYEFLFPDEKPAGPSRLAKLAGEADVLVILDTSAKAQLDGIAERLEDLAEKILVIDHHATVGEIGAVQWVDTTAASTGMMVAELLAALRWPVDARSAEALMAATVSDTGWLKFANTDGRCLRLVAGWLDAGVRPDKLHRQMYQTARLNRLKLLARMLSDLELHCDGRLAVMTLRKEDFAATGARAEETENLVNVSLEVATVETAILLVENPENVRVSFRSRDALDVAAIAAKFGGGGHKRAAGARIADDIDVVKDKLIHICSRALKQAD